MLRCWLVFLGSLKKEVSMKDYQSQSHVKWECKYHVAWCPKYRRKKLYGKLPRRFGAITHELYRQKGVQLIEGHACPDHVNLCLRIPTRHSISSLVGFLKGKSAVRFTSHCKIAERPASCCVLWFY